MKNIIYIPLDERPCNYLYPQAMLNVREDYTLLTPPTEMLGQKKESADIDALWDFVETRATKAEAIIFSVEMMFYGGLLPSRIHKLSEEQIQVYFNRLKALKSSNPNLKIYCSNLIMRTPKYNSADEEPAYYEEFGERIFKRAYFLDKKERGGLTEEEASALATYESEIPSTYIEDYETRRVFNHNVTTEILDLLKAGVIDFLAIPQDDSAEFGYTALDQKKVVEKITERGLLRHVHMYPGADEVGASLLARALNKSENKRPKIYPFYSSTFGPTITPLYEDRPMHESLKAHILVTDSILVRTPEEADIILAINSPGRVMQESWNQWQKDITYTSFRHMLTFTDEIAAFVAAGKQVAICDSAFANGGDIQLLSMLDELKILDQLISYKGWNTNCNTLGTTLAQSIIALGATNQLAIKENLLYHIFEDGFYQAIVRMNIAKEVLPALGANYFDLNGQAEVVNAEMNKRLNACYEQYITHSFKDVEITKCETYSPWHRMFEIGIHFTIAWK